MLTPGCLGDAGPALEQEVAALERDIAQQEEQLRQARHDERHNREGKGKGKALDLVAGDLGDEEDWTVNERGEVRGSPAQERTAPPAVLTRVREQVINEEGLPMFDIREDLPAEPAASTLASPDPAAAAAAEAPPKRRFLIKKGGKQTIGGSRLHWGESSESWRLGAG